MLNELMSIKHAKIFEVIKELPPGRKALGSKMVFKLKTNELGDVVRAKSRLVAKGYNQIEGIENQETTSPVAGANTLRILLAMAALTKGTFQPIRRHHRVPPRYLGQ